MKTYVFWDVNKFDVSACDGEFIEWMHFAALINENRIFHGNIHKSV